MTRKSKNSTRLGTRSLHLMILPSLILLIIYRYLPMIDIVIAFQDFNIGLGVKAFWQSEWVGFAHFKRLFSSPDFTRALFNTLNIAIGKIIAMFFVPLTFTLLIIKLEIG